MIKRNVISFISGKGGVGKSLLVSEIGWLLAKKGFRVLLFDGDFGLANLDIILGTKLNGNIIDVIEGKKNIDQIISSVSSNLDLISSGNGIVRYSQLNSLGKSAMISAILDLRERYDYILIDSSSKMSDFTFKLASSSDYLISLLTPDPSSFTDLYSMIKILNLEFKIEKFMMLLNMVSSKEQALNHFQKFANIVGKFLFLSLDYIGYVTYNSEIIHLSQGRRMLLKQQPSSIHYYEVNLLCINLLNCIEMQTKFENKSGLIGIA